MIGFFTKKNLSYFLSNAVHSLLKKNEEYNVDG